MLRKLVVFLFAISILAPAFAYAQTTDPNVIQFGSGFHVGDTGERVKVLQTLLATDKTIYPEGLVTGYYGNLTKGAIMRYQKLNGLEQVGYVGPKTLALLNSWLLRQQGKQANSTSQSNSTATTMDFATTCQVTTNGVTTSLRWPKSIPCPKDTAVTNTTMPVPAPSPAPTPTPTPSPTPTTSSGNKTCPDPRGNGSYISWPALVPCPAMQTTPTPAPPPALISGGGLSFAPANTLANATSCLGKILSGFGTSSVAFRLAASTCAPETVTRSQLDADAAAANTKTCTLTINGKVLSFPFPQSRPCPMQAVTGVLAANATSSILTTPIDWTSFDPKATTTMCPVVVNGQVVVFPWPSTVPCTGTIPGM
jgi:peptidoglycan hydrolase-like protein with peptidoglycan-binding domain